jgi:hypothetical protein
MFAGMRAERGNLSYGTLELLEVVTIDATGSLSPQTLSLPGTSTNSSPSPQTTFTVQACSSARTAALTNFSHRTKGWSELTVIRYRCVVFLPQDSCDATALFGR